MKKTAIVMMTLLCMILAITLTACSGGGQLATPSNVVISGNSLSWDAVDHATGYIIEVDGKVVTEVVDGKSVDKVIKDTFYTVMTDKLGSHTIRVKAKGTGNYSDSEFTVAKTFVMQSTLPTPVLNIKREGNIVTYTWNAIEGATKYLLKVGIDSVNGVTPVEVTGTSYVIDLDKEENAYYNNVGEYMATVQAVSGDANFINSKESAQVSYINTKQLPAPTKFTCDRTIFQWESTDKDVQRFRVTAIREGDGKVFENTTTSKSLSYDYLGIKEPGKYTVSVVAYNDSKKSVYLESEPSNTVELTILESVDPIHFTLSGSMLSWNAVNGASGYTITATTRTGTSFSIKVNDGASTTYDLSANTTFNEADKVAKMFSFDIIANGNTDKVESLVFDSQSVSMKKGAYYQRLPEAKNYADTGATKGIIPAKVAKEGETPYYSVTTFPELMWALRNADAEIRLGGNITITNTEFVSPITSFNGTFDGRGYTISTINMTDNFDRASLSIFGDLGANAVVKNLVVSNLSVQTSDKNLANGIIANTNNGVIEDVVVVSTNNGDGMVRVLNDSDIALIAHTNNGTIRNVIVKASLQGRNTAGIAVVNNKNIENATVYGKLTGVAIAGETRVGGIAAINKGTIAYGIVRASGLINTAKDATLSIIGGVAGTNTGDIHHTYFTSGIKTNATGTSYAGGFVGVNEGTISASYVESASTITREESNTFVGGFVGRNSGTIKNAYSSISIEKGYYDRKAAFVADNTNGTIERVAYNQGKAGDKATLVLEDKKGTVDALSKGYQSNNLTAAVAEVLGDEFVVYTGFKSTVPLLRNVIYVNTSQISTNIDQNVDLLRKDDFKKYYVGGEAKSVPTEIDGKPNEMRTNNHSGYQIVKYTANVGSAEAPIEVVYNRLIQVR